MLFICNGMTRSGSTLQYNLVRELVDRHEAGQAHGFFETTPSSLSRLQQSWLLDDSIHVIKMHDYWRPADAKCNHHYVRRCHVFRDIRDVGASVYRKFPVTFEETLGILDQAIETDKQIRGDQTVIVQRYQRLLSNPEIALGQPFVVIFAAWYAVSRALLQSGSCCSSEARRSAARLTAVMALANTIPAKGIM